MRQDFIARYTFASCYLKDLPPEHAEDFCNGDYRIIESVSLFLLQTGISMPRASTFRNVACDINEITPLTASRTHIRRCRRGNKKSALGTFPIGQSAPRTDISLEPAVSGVAAVRAYPFLLLHIHFVSLFSVIDLDTREVLLTGRKLFLAYLTL